MTVDVEIGGRTRRVHARRTDAGWVVEVDGRHLSVDAAASNSRWSLLIRAAGASVPASYEVSLEARAGGERAVHVNGRAVPVRPVDPRTLFGRRGHDPAAASAGRVSAPMAGRVVKVLVKPGDIVVAGQPVAVVEAMKMENELRAPGHGTVTEVRAREGMSIEAHAVLVVVE